MVSGLAVLVLIFVSGFTVIPGPAPVAVRVTPEVVAALGPTVAPAPSAVATPAVLSDATAAANAATRKAGGSRGSLTGSRYGIAVGDTLPGLSTPALNAEMNDFKTLGIGWVRLDLDWNDIQPTSAGSYSWGPFDRVVVAANTRGLKLLPIIDYTAPWARPSGCSGSEFCAPANPAQYATFATAAVRRYSPQGVHSWEIWNEENSVGFWKPVPNAAAYVALLRAAYPAIRSADPSATVITGGLASTDSQEGGIGQLDYLTEVYAAGGEPYFNAVGYHPYSYPVPASYFAIWNAWSQMAATPVSLRSIMVLHGDGGKRIWITEYGAPTGGPGLEAVIGNYYLNTIPDHVSEALQALMATDVVAQYRAMSSWTGPMFWYSYRDQGTNENTAENFFGLERADGSRKPAYGAYQAAIR